MRSWEVPRCHPRGPAMLLARSPAPHTAINSDRTPPAPPVHAPEARAQLVTKRCPGARPRRRRCSGSGTGEAPAPPIRGHPGSRGPVPARGGPFPRPGGKMRRREREREGSGPCQKRRGPDGLGWRGQDSPVPMALPPRAGVREGGASHASADGTRGRSWQGRAAPRRRRRGTGHRPGGGEGRPLPQGGGTGQRGSVRRGRPHRCFPPGPRPPGRYEADRTCGATRPGCGRQPLPPVRAPGQAPPGTGSSSGPGPLPAPATARHCPRLPRAAPAPGRQNAPGSLSCRSDRGPDPG